MCLKKHALAKLESCVYGTRGAGQLWEDCYAHKLTNMCVFMGAATPC